MADSKEFNLDEIPATWRECLNMRVKFLNAFNDLEDKTTVNYIDQRANVYGRQGGAYGLLFALTYTLVTYMKFKNYKPHFLGILLGSFFSYHVGAVTGVVSGYKIIIEDFGMVKEDPVLEKQRVEILKRCKKF